MLNFLRALHNRRPILWSVVAFIIMVALATTMSIWWNYLLIQNHRIVREMTAAAVAAERDRSSLPLALLMILGLACSLAIVSGLVYMFLRLIRAVQLNVAQNQFIAAVTHELRSPVASLQIMLETIRDPTVPAEKRAEFESCMQDDLTRLRELVDQVLDTARLENFTSSRPTEPIALAPVIERCAAALAPRLKMSGSRLNVEPPPATLRVKADSRLLAAALGNVLDNALKYSSGAAKIRLRVSESARAACIEVQDDGLGVSRKEQKRIFKRFYRAKDPLSREKPGTGLGLYFARLAIRSIGGDISVQSAGRGLGSTFRIEVPKGRS